MSPLTDIVPRDCGVFPVDIQGQGTSQVAQWVKNLPASAGGRQKRQRFHTWVGKISWRRKWQHTPVFSPRESHGQRSLVGYSPQGLKESDMAEVT